MACWMNESDIDHTLVLAQAKAPQLVPFVRFLGDWRHTVNERSDGWAHYAGGTRCAGNLMEHLDKARRILAYGQRFDERDALPDAATLKRTLSPIRARATKLGWPAPTLGRHQ